MNPLLLFFRAAWFPCLAFFLCLFGSAAVMGNNPSNFNEASLPVSRVSWNEAMEFCWKLTKRERSAGRLPAGYVYTLPTEAEWEYACRAGTMGDYAGNLDLMG